MTTQLPASKMYKAYKFSGWIALMLFVCGFASLADGLIAEMRMGPNRFDVLPNTEIQISGGIPLKDAVKDDFIVDGGSEGSQVEIVLDDFFSSYWFGSGMWRGKVVVGKTPGIGDYFFAIRFKGASERSIQIYHISVWADENTRRAAALSNVTRYSGLSPFLLAGFLLPAGIFIGLINFIFGRLWVKKLLAHGFAEVFKIIKNNEAKEIELTFNFGSASGIFIGQECEVLHPEGNTIALGKVHTLEIKQATIVLPATTKIVSGCLVHPL